MILRQHALAEQRHRCSHWKLSVELDGEGVHGDRADDRARLAGNTHLRSGQVAAKAVRITHRDYSDPRLALGNEAAAVARALSRRELLDLCELAAPEKRRLEPVLRRIFAEGREPVKRDPATGRVEACRRQPKGRGTVGEVTGEVRVGRRRVRKSLNLLFGERGVRICRRKVAHDPDDLRGGSGQLGETPAAHPGVELQMHRNPVRNLLVADRELELGLAGIRDLAVRGGTHDQDASDRKLVAQLEGLGHRRDTQRRCTFPERSSGHVDRTVPVGVRFHDRP